MIKEINISQLTLKELNQISPSKYTVLRNCPLKIVLMKSYPDKLLLTSPNAYYGIVIHEMLDRITKGKIIKENFQESFDNLILRQETKMIADGYKKEGASLVKRCRNFALKKIALSDKLDAKESRKRLNNWDSSTLRSRFINENVSEKDVENSQQTIRGKIDLIEIKNNEITIVDFKTGNIYKDDSKKLIKEEYKEQLVLYGYLYYLTTGNYPNNLAIEDLWGKRRTIKFDIKEAKAIYETALDNLKNINKSIQKKNNIANPSIENCKYCTSKPRCVKFLSDESLHVNTILEVLDKIVLLKNGSTLLFFQNNKTLQIPKSENDEDYRIGETYGFFNLTMVGSSFKSFRFNYYSSVFKYLNYNS